MFHNLGKLQENCKLLQPLAQVDFMMYTRPCLKNQDSCAISTKS